MSGSEYSRGNVGMGCGRNRHVAVDCLGLVLAVLVTAASVQDRDAAVPLLERTRQMYFSIRPIWADGAYCGSLVDWAKEKLQLTLDIVKRCDDRSGFVVLPRGWVVERTLSWLMMRSRRLVRNEGTLPAMHEGNGAVVHDHADEQPPWPDGVGMPFISTWPTPPA